MNYFIYFHIISLLTGRYERNKLTSLPMYGFIAQLVEHRTGIAEVTGSNPVEALIFFQASSFQLNWKIHSDDHSSLSSITAAQIYELFHIYFIVSAYSRFQIPALKNNGVSDSILTTTSERGNPWTTLLEEGSFGIASRPFGKDTKGLAILALRSSVVSFFNCLFQP